MGDLPVGTAIIFAFLLWAAYWCVLLYVIIPEATRVVLRTKEKYERQRAERQ